MPKQSKTLKPVQAAESAISAEFASESFCAEGARVDKEGGKLFDALLFGPKQKEGNFWVAASGPYSREAFDDIASAMEGALAFPFHPQRTSDGEYIPRDAKSAIGKWTGTHVVESATGPEVRGTFDLRKKCRDDYDMVLESPKSFTFSVFFPKRTKIDPTAGEVIVGVNKKSGWRPTCDLVEAGGANKNVFESAREGRTEIPKEEQEMTKEEIQALIDDAVAKRNTAAAEELKGKLAKVDELAAENAKLKRHSFVADKIRASGLDEKYVSETMRATLLDMGTPEDRIEKLIGEQKKMVADVIDPIKNAGHAQEDGKSDKIAVEVVRTRGLDQMVREMAGGVGFGCDRAKDNAFRSKFMDVVGKRLRDQKDLTEETRKLRQAVIEQYVGVGIRNLWSVCYNRFPSSEHDILDVMGQFAQESALDSTGFSTLNNTVLASVMIEAHNSVPGLIADQLTTRYVTNKETENVPGFSEPEDPASTNEGAEKPDATLTNKYVTLQKLTKYARKVLITREAILYDQTGLLLDRANRIAQTATRLREKHLLYGIVDNASFPAYYPSNSQTALYNGNVYVVSNALADWTNLEAAAIKLSEQTDSAGRRITDNAMRPFEILVPHALSFRAERILSADRLESDPSAALNTHFNNNMRGTRVFSSPLLDDLSTTTWYMAGAGGFAKQFLRKVTFPLEIVPVPQAEVQAVIKDLVGGVAVMFAERAFARDNKLVVRSITGASS